MEEEDVRGDRGLSVFRLRAVSRLTLVVRCTEIGYSVSTQVLGFRFGCGWCCVVGFLFGCCWFCVLLLCVSAWWNRGIADEVTMASYGRAVTGTAVMARSANEEKKKKKGLRDRRSIFRLPVFFRGTGCSLGGHQSKVLITRPLCFFGALAEAGPDASSNIGFFLSPFVSQAKYPKMSSFMPEGKIQEASSALGRTRPTLMQVSKPNTSDNSCDMPC